MVEAEGDVEGRVAPHGGLGVEEHRPAGTDEDVLRTDVAFCLNHLLLKRLVVDRAPELNASFSALAGAYLDRVDWENAAGLEARAAALLPALMLARVDGKSPAEYIVDKVQKDFVRRTAIPLLQRPEGTLEAVSAAWDRGVNG